MAQELRLWNYFEPQEARWYRWRLNGAAAYIRRDGDEWRIACKSIPYREIGGDAGGPEEAPPDTPAKLPLDIPAQLPLDTPPESLKCRLALGAGTGLTLRPYLRDRPYLAAIRGGLRLLPGMEARFVLALPPVVQFELTGEKVLADWSPFICSETWYGEDTMSGDLCLSIPAEVGTMPGSPETLPFGIPALIRCELLVRNRARTALDLDRLILYTAPVNVYEDGEGLVCDTIVADALGAGEFRMNVQAPGPGQRRILSVGIKSGVGEILIHRGVSLLKTIAGR
jgi:hypothetical protein